MDDLDAQILRHLGGDARLSLAVLARRLKVARSTVQARLERLESTGVIAGYTLKLGEAARASRLQATVLLTIDLRIQAQIVTRLKAIAGVERIMSTSGRVDLLLQIAAPSPVELDRILDAVGEMAGVRSSESFIHLTTKLDRTV
ncbi:Lrp/AsnC family transcriptional regulator [Phaeovulum vinaykumarii]|uniref:Transcriptional regulator, AsnC family n=1 Tax=Phaeovulum vinaykumarii TaxID=407234 RepID=A0A1N7LUP6_9RHOB|nr:Lrp/AsnC family transcriptional regulator [Phaeovulum vinaykumarii]SIS77595.1 transcriptional regulator, AsnC family [Phaeovulum vinaykumarii]SOC07371.1 AsnC family transcriptional regulator [Phaeovulum vinaykumarii]